MFFKVSLYLYSISVRIEKKFIEQVKEKKISLKYRLCHCASCLCGEKEFSSHTDQCAFSKRVTLLFLTERQTLTFIFSFLHTMNRHFTLKKNQTYRFYFKQPRRKSCHVAASIPFSLDTLIVEREFRLQQHEIRFLSHNEENSSSLVYSIQ